MAEDFDVEAMLEAPFRKEEDVARDSSSSKSKKKKKRSSHDRQSRSGDTGTQSRVRRSRSRERRSRSRDRSNRNHDRNRQDRRRSRSNERRRDRRRSPFVGRGHSFRRSRSRERYGRFGFSPLRMVDNFASEMTPEERDARTVFCMQLSARIRARDLEEFFSAVGKVNDVRLITDNKTRRSKGIAYIEFKDTESVQLALALTGQSLLGVPILVQPSQAEKNRMSMGPSMLANSRPMSSGPMRLYIGSLHFNITEDMLKGIFEPFGKIDDVKLIRDHETGRSQGYGFLTYKNPSDAKKALEQLNGFELAGRPMKVGNVTDRTAADLGESSALDTDEMDRAGIDLGATGRLQLMAKLAEGTGFEIPQFAADALSQAAAASLAGFNQMNAPAVSAMQQALAPGNGVTGVPPIATQCFMLSNMFDSTVEQRVNWEREVLDDVIEECTQHGGLLHVYVDRNSPQGNVYVKCPTVAAADASVNSLHGRYFGGRVITAAYVPLANYSTLFPDSMRATQAVMTTSMTLHPSRFNSNFMAGPGML